MARPQRIESLAGFKAALADTNQDPSHVLAEANKFLSDALHTQDEAVKQLLLDMVKREATTERERYLQRSMIGWLGQYKDPGLFDLWVRLLPLYVERVMQAMLALDDPRAAAPIAELVREEGNGPRDFEYFLMCLAEAGNLDYLGMLAGYLEHPHELVRGTAVWAVLELGYKTGHREVIDLVLPYLDDPHDYVQMKVAYHIGMYFPQEFYARDLGRNLEECLWPPHPDEGEATQGPP